MLYSHSPFLPQVSRAPCRNSRYAPIDIVDGLKFPSAPKPDWRSLARGGRP
jgi:hypothetical protein